MSASSPQVSNGDYMAVPVGGECPTPGQYDEEDHTNEKSKYDPPPLRLLAVTALLLGMIAGIAVQLSTMGVNIKLTKLAQEATPAIKDHVVTLSTCWSIGASCFALLLLASLRGRVARIARAAFHENDDEASAASDEVVVSLEYAFVAGALIGGWFGWTVVDLAMGLQVEAVYSLVIFAVCLLWLGLILSCVLASKSRASRSNDDEQRDQPTKPSELMIV